MGLLSNNTSITRYKVQGKISEPVLATIAKALNEHSIKDIDNEDTEKICGWTSFEHPYRPDFENSSFNIGTYLVFSLRIDQKKVPTRIIKKHFSLEMSRRLAESGREYLSKNEKKDLKEHLISVLTARMPATPNVYDIIWHYEEGLLWFFSTLKSANEELETLFNAAFNLKLIHLFPYTTTDLLIDLTDLERNRMNKLKPTDFTE